MRIQALCQASLHLQRGRNPQVELPEHPRGRRYVAVQVHRVYILLRVIFGTGVRFRL